MLRAVHGLWEVSRPLTRGSQWDSSLRCVVGSPGPVRRKGFNVTSRRGARTRMDRPQERGEVYRSCVVQENLFHAEESEPQLQHVRQCAEC